MSGRGGYSGRGTSNKPIIILKDPEQLLHPWSNEVDNLLHEIRLNTMREIKTVITNAITSQISELAIVIETQIIAAITADISADVTDTLTLSPVDLDEDLELIAQSPTIYIDVSQTTPMEVDTDPRKRKEPTASEEPLTTVRVTPTRHLRPQKHQGLVGTLKKTLNEGKNTDYEVIISTHFMNSKRNPNINNLNMKDKKQNESPNIIRRNYQRVSN